MFKAFAFYQVATTLGAVICCYGLRTPDVPLLGIGPPVFAGSWILRRTHVPVARNFLEFLPVSYVGRYLPHTPVCGTMPVSSLFGGAD